MRKLLYLLIFIVLALRFFQPLFSDEKTKCPPPGNGSQYLYLLLIDESGSLGDQGVKTVKHTFDALGDSLLSDSNVMVRKFSDLIVGDEAYSRFDKIKLMRVIDYVVNYGTVSRFYDALYMAQKHMRNIADQSGLIPYIIVYTDGFNENSAIAYEALKKTILENNVPIIVFPIDGKKHSNTSVLDEITRLSCGILLKPNTDSATIKQIFSARAFNDRGDAPTASFQETPTQTDDDTSAPVAETGDAPKTLFGETSAQTDDDTSAPVAETGDAPKTLFGETSAQTDDDTSAPVAEIEDTPLSVIKDASERSMFSGPESLTMMWWLLLLFFLALLSLLVWLIVKRRRNQAKSEHAGDEPENTENLNDLPDSPYSGKQRHADKNEDLFSNEPDHVTNEHLFSNESDHVTNDTEYDRTQTYSKNDVFNDTLSDEVLKKSDAALSARSESIELIRKRLASTKNPPGESAPQSESEGDANFYAPDTPTLFDRTEFLSQRNIEESVGKLQRVIDNIEKHNHALPENMLILSYIVSGAVNPQCFVSAVGKANALRFAGKFSSVLPNLNEYNKEIALKALHMIAVACGFEFDGTPDDYSWQDFCRINAEVLPEVGRHNSEISTLIENAIKSHIVEPVTIVLKGDASSSTRETVGACIYNRVIFFSTQPYGLFHEFSIHSEKNQSAYKGFVDQIQYYKSLDLFRYEFKLVQLS